MTEYTVIVETDDRGGRILVVKGLVHFHVFDEIKEKLGNIYALPVNEEIKVKLNMT